MMHILLTTLNNELICLKNDDFYCLLEFLKLLMNQVENHYFRDLTIYLV